MPAKVLVQIGTMLLPHAGEPATELAELGAAQVTVSGYTRTFERIVPSDRHPFNSGRSARVWGMSASGPSG